MNRKQEKLLRKRSRKVRKERLALAEEIATVAAPEVHEDLSEEVGAHNFKFRFAVLGALKGRPCTAENLRKLSKMDYYHGYRRVGPLTLKDIEDWLAKRDIKFSLIGER